MSVKSILGHFWKNWNETNSNPGALIDLEIMLSEITRWLSYLVRLPSW